MICGKHDYISFDAPCPKCASDIKAGGPEGDTTRLMERGLKMMKSFTCEHKPTCDEAEEERGGCCNSCWARRWAEDMEKRLLAEKTK